MTKTPLISVIIPCYNHASYIGNSIDSVINQTYTPIELIVINDGSIDDSHERILEYKARCEKRFVRYLYINKENEGLAKTLNQAVRNSRGELLSLLASDDMFMPTKLEILVTEFERLDDSVELVFGDAQFVDDKGRSVELTENGDVCVGSEKRRFGSFIDYYTRRRLDLTGQRPLGSYASLVGGNYIPAPSVLVRRTALINVGLFDEDILNEDWSMWLKLAKYCKLHYLDESVACYRWHANNFSKLATEALIDDHEKILLREQEYCRSHNLYEAWKMSYARVALYLLRHGYWVSAYHKAKNLGVARLIGAAAKYVVQRCMR